MLTRKTSVAPKITRGTWAGRPPRAAISGVGGRGPPVRGLVCAGGRGGYWRGDPARATGVCRLVH